MLFYGIEIAASSGRKKPQSRTVRCSGKSARDCTLIFPVNTGEERHKKYWFFASIFHYFAIIC